MKPDWEVAWKVYNTDSCQWVESWTCFGTSEDCIKSAQCSQFIEECLKGFGVQIKARGAVLCKVGLAVKDGKFWINRHDYQFLMEKERLLAIAVANLFYAWAKRELLTEGSDEDNPGVSNEGKLWLK